MKYNFPKNFLWGSSVWATGVESASNEDDKASTVWDEYYRIDSNHFYNKVGPNDTLDFYHNYDKISDLLVESSQKSFRTSILWARLIPNGKNVNSKAVQFYENAFKSIKQKGIYLSVVLYWFDMPLLYENKGGFSNPDIIDDFVYYCKTCFDLFSKYVDTFFIYNEPIMDVLYKYQMGVCYPKERDLNKSFNAIYNMCLAHALVVKEFKNGKYESNIGSVLNQSYVYPRSETSGDLFAKKMYEVTQYESFEYPLLKGYFSEDWLKLVKDCGVDLKIKEGDLKLLNENKIEFLGINCYLPVRVKEKVKDKQCEMSLGFVNSPFFDHYVWKDRKFNVDRGWEIYPKVIYDLLMKNKKEYPNVTMMITENGIGIANEGRYREDDMINDTYRIEFIKDHIKYLHKAIKDGANVIGYHVWSFVDLWSPTNQFKNCYGLYEFDLKTHEIKKKASACFYTKLCVENGFEEEEKNV